MGAVEVWLGRVSAGGSRPHLVRWKALSCICLSLGLWLNRDEEHRLQTFHLTSTSSKLYNIPAPPSLHRRKTTKTSGGGCSQRDWKSIHAYASRSETTHARLNQAQRTPLI